MATISIDPIDISTKGGFSAKIIGINPTDDDFLRGIVNTPALGNINVRWNSSGICRNNDQKCNILPEEDEIKDVIKTANILMGNTN